MPQEIDNIAVSVGKVCWQPAMATIDQIRTTCCSLEKLHVVFYMIGVWIYPYKS
jgi:hypothetical protein